MEQAAFLVYSLLVLLVGICLGVLLSMMFRNLQ